MKLCGPGLQVGEVHVFSPYSIAVHCALRSQRLQFQRTCTNLRQEPERHHTAQSPDDAGNRYTPQATWNSARTTYSKATAHTKSSSRQAAAKSLAFAA